MSSILFSRARLPLAAIRRQAKRIGPLGSIILLHLVLLYLLQSGLLRQAAHAALPKVVLATFILPERPPQPEAPKPVPVVKRIRTPPPLVPVVNAAPSPQAISVPPAPPQPPEPAVAAAAPAPAAPPASAVSARPKFISSGIEYIQQPRPEYPSVSRRTGEEGSVTLRAQVNDKGRPERVEVQKSSGSERLDAAARQAALRAVFKPHVEDGRAVAVYAIVPIKFQLDS